MIRVEHRGAVAIVTIDRPDRRNALDDEHEIALSEALMTSASDPGVRAIVLTGVASSFCAGADLRDRLPAFRDRVLSGEEPVWSFGGLTGAGQLEVPIIAAVNGHAIGGGFELALACDVRVCTPAATFTMVEARWAITPGAGGMVRLPRVIGLGPATDILLTARPVGAEEAFRVGLVSRLIGPETMLDEAVEIAETIAANGPLAVAAVREKVEAVAAMPLEQALAAERETFLRLMRTADAAEGTEAFTRKRVPHYEGK